MNDYDDYGLDAYDRQQIMMEGEKGEIMEVKTVTVSEEYVETLKDALKIALKYTEGICDAYGLESARVFVKRLWQVLACTSEDDLKDWNTKEISSEIYDLYLRELKSGHPYSAVSGNMRYYRKSEAQYRALREMGLTDVTIARSGRSVGELLDEIEEVLSSLQFRAELIDKIDKTNKESAKMIKAKEVLIRNLNNNPKIALIASWDELRNRHINDNPYFATIFPRVCDWSFKERRDLRESSFVKESSDQSSTDPAKKPETGIDDQGDDPPLQDNQADHKDDHKDE